LQLLMASYSGWNKDQPSGASLLRDADDMLRSDKSILQATLQQEHYFTDGSANSAGEHKLGSARIYSGASSAVSSSGQSGRLMWDETNSQLVALHAATSTRLPSLAVENTWAAAQTFSDGITSTNVSLSGFLNFTGTAAIKEAGTERGRIVSGALRWGTTAALGAAGEIVVANNKRIGCITKGGATFMGMQADPDTDFLLNLNTGGTSGSGGFVRLPFTTVIPSASTLMDGVLLGDANTKQAVYYIGGQRMYLSGTTF
jgi:hypothetical protein